METSPRCPPGKDSAERTSQRQWRPESRPPGEKPGGPRNYRGSPVRKTTRQACRYQEEGTNTSATADPSSL